MRIEHKKYGRGTVIHKRVGDNSMLVRFDNHIGKINHDTKPLCDIEYIRIEEVDIKDIKAIQ